MISSLKKLFKPKDNGAVVLMYHRIASCDSDPWSLCVSAENFDAHVRELKQNFHVIPMFRLAERIKQGGDLKGVVAITFDDGYLDNFQVAGRILQKHNVPATFYFPGKKTAELKKFWWDELERLILHTPVLPDSANISLEKKTITLILGEVGSLSDLTREQNKSWRYGDPFHNARIKLYYELWEELKTMTIQQQREGIAKIKGWVGTNIVTTPPLMDDTQIREMAETGLFEIGGHTVNHPALGALSSTDQLHEIRENRNFLLNTIGQPVTGFAYPYGHYNKQTPSITRTTGYQYAVTTEERLATHRDSVFEIPRFQVKDIRADELLNNIKTWSRT